MTDYKPNSWKNLETKPGEQVWIEDELYNDLVGNHPMKQDSYMRKREVEPYLPPGHRVCPHCMREVVKKCLFGDTKQSARQTIYRRYRLRCSKLPAEEGKKQWEDYKQSLLDDKKSEIESLVDALLPGMTNYYNEMEYQ